MKKTSGYLIRRAAIVVLLLSALVTLTSAFHLPNSSPRLKFTPNLPNNVTLLAVHSQGPSSLIGKGMTAFGGNGMTISTPSTSPLPVWAIETSPDGPTTRDSYLYAVTCVSGSHCWAVGYYSSDPFGYAQTLIEEWNGTSWSVVTSPNTSAIEHNQLYGVVCGSASDCWAVGYHTTDTAPYYHTLIEHWDGTSWSIVTSPTPAANSDYDNVQLTGVACSSASSCWAVGYYGGNYYTNTINQTLIEQWDGTQWSIVTSPNNPSPGGHYYFGNYLQGVRCTSNSNCWAVGNYSSSTVYFSQTLIEQWDGTSWSIVASPNILVGGQSSDNDLSGVTCTSASDCWAVGNGGNTQASYYQTLTEHWDGTSWSIVTSPSPGNFGNWLADVTCASASDCWAIGLSGDDKLIFEQWNGTLWSAATLSPPSLVPDGGFNGVTCASASDCWAVGYYQTVANGFGTNHTLIATLTTSPITITTSASPTQGGTTSGGSTYVSGSSVTVNAAANNGYIFTSWTENGSVVSTSASYIFTATSDRTLVANFVANVSPTPTPTPTPTATFTPTPTATATATATFTPTPTATPIGTHPAFFNGETALGGGWYYLQFPNGTPFGYYSYLPDQNFIYHLDLGFEYLFDANDSQGGIYFYDFASNSFFYTSPTLFPDLYDFSLNAWLYYLPDVHNPGRYTHNPRWFFNFATGQWITL